MEILVPKEDKPLCTPVERPEGRYSWLGKKRVSHAEILGLMRESRPSRVSHTDGNLFLGGIAGKWDCSVSGHKWSNTMEKFCLNCGVDQ